MLPIYLLLWVAAAAVTVYVAGRRKARTVGLLLAYLVNLALIHFLGAALYLLPVPPSRDVEVVTAGFEQSTYAVLAFAVGALLIAPVLFPKPKLAPGPSPIPPALIGPNSITGNSASGAARGPRVFSLAQFYIAVGLLAYLVLGSTLGKVPTLGALLAAAWNLIPVGIVVAYLQARAARRPLQQALWVSTAVLLPMATTIREGFLGYGVAALSVVVAVAATFHRPRWHTVLLSVMLVPFCLSIYVTYMRDRNAIRAVVWGDEEIPVRVAQVLATLEETEWIDLSTPAHVQRIDTRLNQNRLVGRAIEYLGYGAADYALGETILDGVLAVIPRALWQEKPMAAGSGDLVTRFTGIQFVKGISVGIGQVMEFYVNFGTLGVILGFLVLGTAIAVIDAKAARLLAAGDYQGFAFWLLVGVSLLQAGGSLVELTSSFAAAAVLGWLLNRVVLPRMSIAAWADAKTDSSAAAMIGIPHA